MALQDLLDQSRIIDPYQQRVFEHGDPPTEDSRLYLSRASNILTDIVGNDVVLTGMDVSASIESGNRDLTATVEAGIAIIDSTIVEVPEGTSTSVTFANANNYDPDGGNNYFMLFLNYQYLESLEDNPVKLKLVFMDNTAQAMYPPTQSLQVDQDRILLAVIEFTKAAGFLSTVQVYNEYWSSDNDRRDVVSDLLTLPTPVTHYLGGWGPKITDMNWGGINMDKFFKAQSEFSDLLLNSPDGNRWKINVSNSGDIFASPEVGP